MYLSFTFPINRQWKSKIIFLINLSGKTTSFESMMLQIINSEEVVFPDKFILQKEHFQGSVAITNYFMFLSSLFLHSETIKDCIEYLFDANGMPDKRLKEMTNVDIANELAKLGVNFVEKRIVSIKCSNAVEVHNDIIL